MYLYGCVSLLAPEFDVCLCVCVCVCVLCVCVCVRSNQSTSKNPHYASDLSKLDALLHKTCIKVLSFDICASMMSLSKIAHQMWRDHPFSHRNKTTEKAVGTGSPTGVENIGGGGGGLCQ